MQQLLLMIFFKFPRIPCISDILEFFRSIPWSRESLRQMLATSIFIIYLGWPFHCGTLNSFVNRYNLMVLGCVFLMEVTLLLSAEASCAPFSPTLMSSLVLFYYSVIISSTPSRLYAKLSNAFLLLLILKSFPVLVAIYKDENDPRFSATTLFKPTPNSIIELSQCSGTEDLAKS